MKCLIHSRESRMLLHSGWGFVSAPTIVYIFISMQHVCLWWQLVLRSYGKDPRHLNLEWPGIKN